MAQAQFLPGAASVLEELDSKLLQPCPSAFNSASPQKALRRALCSLSPLAKSIKWYQVGGLPHCCHCITNKDHTQSIHAVVNQSAPLAGTALMHAYGCAGVAHKACGQPFVHYLDVHATGRKNKFSSQTAGPRLIGTCCASRPWQLLPQEQLPSPPAWPALVARPLSPPPPYHRPVTQRHVL